MGYKAWIAYWVSASVALTPLTASLAVNAAETEYLEKLQEKYDTKDPYNQTSGDESRLNRALNSTPASNPNLEADLIERHFTTPPASTSSDYSRYGIISGAMQSKIDEVRGDHDQLTQNTTNFNHSVSGSNLSLQTQYKETAVSRDANGNLVVNYGDTVTNTTQVHNSEMVGAQQGHSETVFDGDQQYGDADGVLESGRSAYGNLSTATTGEGIAFRTILQSQQSNPPPVIDPRSSLFDYGFDEVNRANSGQDDWFANCQQTTRRVTHSGEYGSSHEQTCQRPNYTNLQSCQVERTAKLPIRLVTMEGDLQKYTIEIADEYTLRIRLGPYNDNGIPDARIYNSDLKSGESSYGKYACRVTQQRFLFKLEEGFEVVSGYRHGSGSSVVSGRVDDTLKVWVNGALDGYFRQRPYSSQSVWDKVPESLMVLPKHYLYDFPYDARAGQLFAGVDGGWNTCEHKNGSVGSADISHIVSRTNSNGHLLFEYALGLGGAGDIDLAYDIRFNKPVSPVVTYEQTPEGCADKIGWSPESNNKICPTGGCASPLTKPDSFCKADRWVTVVSGGNSFDESILETMAPMYDGDGHQVSWKINAEGYLCDPLQGQPWCVDTNDDGAVDPSMECFDYFQMREGHDNCQVLEDRPECKELTSSCDDRFYDRANDECYMNEVIYECTDNGDWEYEHEVVDNECSGLLPCANGECNFGAEETNPDFINAMVHASILQHAQGDYACDDPSDPSTCKIFAGEGKFCSWERSGLGNDCCEAPEGVNLAQYVALANAMMQVTNYAKAEIPVVKDGIDKMTEPLSQAGDAVGKAVSNAWDSITTEMTSVFSNTAGSTVVSDAAGGVTSVADVTAQAAEAAASGGEQAGEAVAEGFVDEMKQEAMNWLAENLPADLSSAVFTVPSDEAVDVQFTPEAQLVADVFGYVMLAYTIYNYAKLLINLYSQCHEYEMDMGIKIAQKQCVKVGGSYKKDSLGLIKRQDYCCYSSILSRIINEAAVDQLGVNMATYSSTSIDGSTLRSCEGLTADQLAQLDFDQIDFSEWLGLLMESEVIPPELSEEALTRDGRTMNAENRQTTKERTAERIGDDHSLADRAIEHRETMSIDNVDCSYLPRPPVCEFGIVIGEGGGG
ncbi:conjugal transfer protein TraN [Ferrimonas kyonanensis]|uniref:conjugal transfer protein TraN n=1 Tax=Ferrimonas kyonanensis TaxID=364763 RepID=UPI0004265E1C|nr:conjugal transfer protein TraN [Ferrimonas kyonanensis]